MVYKASRDGFEKKTLEQICVSSMNMLIVIKSNYSNIFGVYLNCRQLLIQNYKNGYVDPNAFSFSLTNELNKTFKLNVLNPKRAVAFHTYSNLIEFDYFYIIEQSHLGGSFLTNTDKLNTIFNSSKPVLSGSDYFKVDEIEAYEIQNGKFKFILDKSIQNKIIYYFYALFIKGCWVPQCENKATCVPNNSNYTCLCLNGFYGRNCEYKILNSSIFVNSTILSQETSLELLNLTQFSKDKTFKLIYQASRDGFLSNNFHSKVDGINKTLIVIKTIEGYIFGGYTEADWSGSWYKYDANAFIYFLNYEILHVLTQKYTKFIKLNVIKPSSAIFISQSYGACFGEISVYNNSKISVGGIYLNSENGAYTSYFTYSFREQFAPDEIEVFALLN